ncbi:MAG: serine/threonine-protein kinase, partial [Acidobacteriota bacterium]|nr:serine/threonine-protein kinase [Acidobacteriota bacterium]
MNKTDPEVIRAVLGPRYRIERDLGEAGAATAYLAWDGDENRQVELKVLLPELTSAVGAERFRREIATVAKLSHAHILPVYGSGEADGVLYYTTPHLEGETLRDRLDREGQLPIDEAVEIARQVAGALDYAHEHDVVHRDIKPETVLLTAGGAVVTDFGVARAIDRAGGERLTETGLLVGTPAYMSPEQAEGGERLDGRSDQYSLACVLYEMLAGHPPFAGSSDRVVLSRAAKDDVPPLSSARATVSGPLEAVIHKALSKTAADRFRRAERFAEALSMAERGATPPGVTPIGVKPPGVTRPEVRVSHNVWTELARRRVYQVAVSYLVVAWALVQVAEATFGPLGVPGWAHRTLLWSAIGGFP